MEKVGLNFMTMESTLYARGSCEQPTLKDAIGDLENDRTEVQIVLDFVQSSFQKKWIELLPFSPDKHRKPSDPEFIDINPKQSMFNMIRSTLIYLALL